MSKTIGVDVGTMFMVASKKLSGDKIEYNSLRNMFLPVTDDLISVTEMAESQIDYVKAEDEDGEDTFYIISEDAYKFGNMFNKSVSRPMSKGVISPDEVDAIDVLTLMLEKICGKTRGGNCIYSVPEAAIDVEIPPVLYHERVFGKIFETLGYNSKPLNEAMAIIYSECQDEKFSGISISFGSGLTNVACAYKGTPIMTFAVSRGGDWIDSNAASSLGIVQNRVTSVKESEDMDLMNPFIKDKKTRRTREAVAYYYKSLIDYVLKVIVNKFKAEADDLQIDETIPIIVSGGTSKPEGFLDMFKSVFESHKNFPYEISEIRQAKDPLNAVATGCLIYGMWEQKKKDKSKGGPRNGEEN